MITWALGWAHYCNGDLDEAERWLTETTALAPPVDQWIVGVAAIADLSLIAGRRGRKTEQMRLALQAVELAGECGLLDAVEDGEVHTAHGVALLADGRPDEALAALEKGVFLRRLWGQPLDLIDGLIELATAVAATGDRPRAADLLDEAQELVAACRDAGALPARLRAARRAARIVRPASDAAGRRAQRARAHRPAPSGHRALRARDRRRALPLVQHGAQPRQGDLPQAARCPRAPTPWHVRGTSGCADHLGEIARGC